MTVNKRVSEKLDYAQRMKLSWFILLVGLLILLSFLISIPIGINLVQQRATQPLLILSQANQGELLVNGSRPLTYTSEEREVGDNIKADFLEQGALQFLDESRQLRARVQIYQNSLLRITNARQPQFNASDKRDVIELTLDYGRIRVSITPDDTGRTVKMRIKANHTTPQGYLIPLEPGEYVIESTKEKTQLTVLSGSAEMLDLKENSLIIYDEQRAIIQAGLPPEGPYDHAQNLITNGDFANQLNGWISLPWEYQGNENEPFGGEVSHQYWLGEPVLRIERNAVGPSFTNVRQTFPEEISDITTKSSLTLSIDFIIEQSIFVCGERGSECPLSVSIIFENPFGNEFEWKQGFYTKGQPNDDTSPGFCKDCASQLLLNDHWRAPEAGIMATYESPNILSQLKQEDFTPIRIKNIYIRSAGHQFKVDVVNISLLATD